ncbi:MAG: sigma factor-like helix-turn-helix DNA-binding protein [Gemmatimonadaceae bacterium]
MTDPEQEVLLAVSVGLALLVVLEALAPAERVAFVLHDMFDLPFDEIAPIIGRSPAAAPRARRGSRCGGGAMGDAIGLGAKEGARRDRERAAHAARAMSLSSLGEGVHAVHAPLPPWRELMPLSLTRAALVAAAWRGVGAKAMKAGQRPLWRRAESMR